MEKQIRHRRLHAFYNSKVLNSLMIVVIASLLSAGYTNTFLMPVVCASVALGLFIGYSLWLWIKKPQRVVVNGWLSEMNGLLTLYFLIICALDSGSPWWYVLPSVCAIGVFFINMIRPKDEIFEI